MCFDLRKGLLKTVLSLVLVLGTAACVDPVEPEFAFRLGLVYIDALAGTSPGSSYVKISESVNEFGINKNRFLSGAQVLFLNSDTGNTISLTEQEEVYVPPADFMTSAGEQWELRITMPDGTTYNSLPETVRQAVPITGLSVQYNPELIYNEGLDSRIPGHRISVDFVDPASTNNYYLWRYRSFERLVYCHQCFDRTVFRDGICEVINPGDFDSPLLIYYTYACEERCWQIRYSDEINIFSDTFSNGATVTQLPVSDIPLYTKRNLLVELQQFSLTEDAYRYYKTLKDLIDNNSGFNAPLPAALIGNLYNPEDSQDLVLGRFTAAATSVMPIFIERIYIDEEQLEPVIFGQAEGLETPPPQVLTAPCVESRFRTNEQPAGWQD